MAKFFQKVRTVDQADEILAYGAACSAMRQRGIVSQSIDKFSNPLLEPEEAKTEQKPQLSESLQEKFELIQRAVDASDYTSAIEIFNDILVSWFQKYNFIRFFLTRKMIPAIGKPT